MKETGMEIQDIWGCVFHGFVCLCVCSGFFRGVGGGGGEGVMMRSVVS